MFKKYLNNLDKSSKIAIIGLAMTVLGLIGIIPALYNNSSPALAASPTTTEATTTPTQVVKEEIPDSISGHPVRVVASTVGVDMNVVDGFYNNTSKEWTLSDDKAMFGTMTTEPNNKSGQTFIYGHATQKVFGKLLNMHVGDQVEVYTSNGYKFTYTLKETEVVTPQNTGILAYTGSPRLLLQTCVGTFSENRKFFILDFTKVDKL